MIKNEYQLRQQIVNVGRLMYEKGLICASDGNISARLGPGRILITPSGLHKGMMEPDQLLVVDENGERAGSRIGANRQLKPTSELPMHLEVYRQRPDVEAVVHAHPPITVALSIAGISLADCFLPEMIVFLGIIPTTEYATPSSTENVRAVRELIVKHDALVLKRHGSITVGNSPMQAFMRLETMEQGARIRFMLAQLGVNNPLPAEEIRKLMDQRQQLGLSQPGEAAEFSAACNLSDEKPGTPPVNSGPINATAISAADPATIRMLVSQVVNKTLGSP